MEEKNKTEEKVLKAASGMMMLVLGILMILVSIPLIVAGCVWNFLVQSVIVSVVLLVLGIIVLCGLKILQPNEALVLTLFGKYYGTLYNAGLGESFLRGSQSHSGIQNAGETQEEYAEQRRYFSGGDSSHFEEGLSEKDDLE